MAANEPAPLAAFERRFEQHEIGMVIAKVAIEIAERDRLPCA